MNSPIMSRDVDWKENDPACTSTTPSDGDKGRLATNYQERDVVLLRIRGMGINGRNQNIRQVMDQEYHHHHGNGANQAIKQSFIGCRLVSPLNRSPFITIVPVEQMVEELDGQNNLSDLSDIEDMIQCKPKRHEKKRNIIEIEGEVNVPIYVEELPILALVDSGANFSSLNKKFCLQNNICIIEHTEASKPEIYLAKAGEKSSSYGYTDKLKLRYNGKSYLFQFEVMDLAFDKPMSIGTDLMKALGIGYTGLAITWDLPTKEIEESPFKDAPQPNEDPFGTAAEQQDFLKGIRHGGARNLYIQINLFVTANELGVCILDFAKTSFCNYKHFFLYIQKKVCIYKHHQLTLCIAV